MKLFCILVGVPKAPGAPFSVKVNASDSIDDLKKAIKEAKKNDLEKIDANKLRLYLTKSGDTWLGSRDAQVKALMEGRIPNEIKQLLSEEELYSTDEIGDCFVNAPEKNTIHVLVQPPSDACNFSLHAPKPLVSSPGAKWNFQNPLRLDHLASEIESHYKAWENGNKDKASHPLFLCLDGPGTGKSRLLNEFPNIVQHQLPYKDKNEKMMRLLQNAFTFNVTFENGTTALGNFADSSEAIGARMLYQLQDSMEWGGFMKQTAHHLSPDQVLEKLPEISGKDPHEMCVILCVDSLQKLDHGARNKETSFYHALGSLCDLVNGSKYWVIAIGSATIYQPVKEFIAASSQKRILLQTKRLSRPFMNNKDVFKQFENEDSVQKDLVQLLIDDMGGFGRAIEVLYSVLEKTKNKRILDFATVLRDVVDTLRNYYSAIGDRVNNMRDAFLAVIARRVVDTDSMFGTATLDDVISAGLIRRNNNFLECPYVLYLMLDTDEFPWDEFRSYAPRQNNEDRKPWQAWEQFNCKFRVLKSIAYKNQEVDWTHVHCGARFGPGCDRTVKEVERKYASSSTRMDTKSKGFNLGKCSCNNDSNNPRFLYQPADGSPSGDSFLCLEDTKNGFFHEVHQCKRIQGTLSLKDFKDEKKKAVGKDDLFMLFCTGDVSSDIDDSVLQNCAIVDRSCWQKYYGPFAARAFFMEVIPGPYLNECSDVELALVQGIGKTYNGLIIEERNKRLFDDYNDAHERTGIPLPILKRYRLTPPPMAMEE